MTAADPRCARGKGASPLPWHDVATHRPGQAARAQAVRELTALRERGPFHTAVRRLFDVKTDERAWRMGAEGEASVGARLEKLSKRGWHVLHAVLVGTRGSDIDHVVIGRGGVFTLNTKRRPRANVWVGDRAIQVNGQPTPYLRNSRHEAERAGRVLSDALGFPVPVRPVLVFVTDLPGSNLSIKRMPKDVIVADHRDVSRVLRRSRRQLDTDQVELIYEQARRCTTWTGSTHCSCGALSP